jgi:hypothetical protein
MEKVTLAITLHDGQTIHAELRPEDEQRLTERFIDGSTIQLTATDDDLQGHAFAGSVLVNVLDHAIPLRLPNAADAAALQRSLAVGALTATLVGALAISVVPTSTSAPTGIDQAANDHILNVPAMAVRAQRDEMAREQVVYLSRVPLDADNPAIPAQALRAEQAEMARDAAFAGTQATAGESAQEAAQVTTQSILLDVNNPAVPAQALRAEQAEMAREGQAAGAQVASQAISPGVAADADNPAIPNQAKRAGTQ